ncbi:MAG: BatA domain-containing protein, partial [Planctomycetota bacterium]|nr:BatA domain-containing protein [Planctomycetota bacterium]
MPTFVSPLLLTGGLLIGVPILLHLVMRERPRPYVFPALRFLRQRREANRRRLRLRHWLLLLLRCAAIALFALAVARPVFQSAGFLSGGRAPVAAAVVIDTRPRMLYRHRNQTRLEAAQQLARQILQELPTDSDLVVLDSSSGRSRFDVDRGAAAGRVDQLQVTYAGQDLLDTLDSALAVLRPSDKQHKEVFILTDMAASDWQQPQQITAWRQRVEENPELGIYLVDVGVQEIENFALGDLTLSQEVLSENGMLRIETQATTDGSDGQRTVQLFLEGEDGKPQKKGQQTVDCRAGEMQSVEFKAALGQLGPHQGYVRFARSDNLSVDDVRYFTVSVQPPWNLLVVAPQPADRNARLLTGALAPVTLRRRGEAQFEFDIVDQEEFAQRRLRAYDAVWLLDPKPLSVEVWNRLTSFVSGGGGLAITLGGRAGLTGEQFNASASLELLPAELKRQWKNYDLYLAPDRLEHAVLYRFKSREGDIPWALNPV